MKNETIIKVLKQYSKSLAFMEKESLQDGNKKESRMCAFDKLALDNAIDILRKE